MQMQRPLHHIVIHLRHQGLDRSNVHACTTVVLIFIDLPCRAQHEKFELLDLDPRVGNLLLHHLFLRQHLALSFP